MTETDLRLLDSYRRSFFPAYERVVGAIRELLGVQVTGRPAKSTTSIVEKLRRESIRLSQMQDIAGCRLIVEDAPAQQVIGDRLARIFMKSTIIDRRKAPSHGYRSIHVVVNVEGRRVEVQVRTLLQHLWAELSERLSDRFDPAIKYGGGRKDVLNILNFISLHLGQYEDVDLRLAPLTAKAQLTEEESRRVSIATASLRKSHDKVMKALAEAIALLRRSDPTR